MNRFVIILACVIIPLVSSAQLPEFSLSLKFFVNDNPGQHKEIFLGYDPNASDSLEGKNAYTALQAGGEQLYPPPFNYDDARFTGYTIGRGYLAEGGPIDIRRKPDSTSFILNYEISLTTTQEATSGSFIWDNKHIPQIINHIFLEPATISPGPARKRTDLKEGYRFDMPNRDSLGKYSKILVSLYYNREPLSNVDHDDVLDKSVSISSNPLTESSTLSIFVERTSDARISIYDVSGRVVYSFERTLGIGLNTMPLHESYFPLSGAYYIQIRTSDARGTAITSRIVHKIK